MACDSGCCGPSQSPPQSAVTQPTVSLPLADEHTGDDADYCWNVEHEPTCNSVDTCQVAYCDSRTKATPGQDNRPNCCEGRPFPCCNSSCIDQIALRECVNQEKKPTAPSECTHGKSGKPCRYHTRRTRNQYQSKLETLGCICRMLLALGQESCCASSRQPPLQKKRSPSGASMATCAPTDSCCAPKTPKQATPAKNMCTDACCGDAKSSTCADDEDGPCADTCRTGMKTSAVQNVTGITSNLMNSSHLETGLAGKEHIILNVSGMTCTGCETKLLRTLSTIPSLTKLRTSLVLSRVEFDLDTGLQSVAEVMKYLERTTEFKFERVTQGSTIDLICNGDSVEFVEGNWPKGVNDVRMINRKTIRVNFDAKVIGARDLVKNGWLTPMELAPPCVDSTLNSGARHVRHVGYMTLLSILLTIPVLILSWAPFPNREDKKILFSSISLAFATIIQFVVAGPFYPKAFKALVFSRVIEMDLLVVLSTSAAYIFSVVAFGHLIYQKPLSTGEFFETSTLLVTLIMVGRFIAALARQKAVESISIRSLQTPTATIVHPDGSSTEEDIDARLLQYGDIFKVYPDSRIPTDGTVISGASEVDESMLTGESRPIEKSKGSIVIAGSTNRSGALTVRLTRIPGDNTISTVASMVDEAKLSKPKIQELADQVANYFVPVIFAITVVVFCVWIGIGIAVQQKSGSEAVIQAVTYAITVLIVSCPCAIGLAVPMVIVVATGIAAEKGVVFKSADAIEIAWKTAHVVFDKTGTLTQGKLKVVRVDFPNSSPNAKSLLLGLIGSSKHPVSISVASHLKAEGINETSVFEPKSVVGKGVEGKFAGRTLRAGNSRWLGLSDNPLVLSVLSQGCTAFCFTMDDEVTAVFGLEDSLRGDSLDTVTKLQQSGIAVHVLSGDDDSAVRTVTTRLGIPDLNVQSRCTPADKQAYINKLLNTPDPHRSKRKPTKPVVMFCGDGTNDAVALAQASIGIHMNEGTDVAQSAADVVLMRPSLGGIIVAIAASRKSIHRVRFNFGWSFFYNVFAILLSAGAFVNARIPPEFAGLGELISVLPVVAAGMLLKWEKI